VENIFKENTRHTKMKKYIFGTKGFAKEVEFIIFENFGLLQEVIFVAEDNSEDLGTKINGREVISESEFLNNSEEVECYIAVGNPKIKRKIYNKLAHKANIFFPNLIHKTVILDARYVSFGFGNIICSHASLTTNIKLGNFVHINLNSTIDHDTVIEDFVTISPGVNISGNVLLQELSYLGTNCAIIEKRIIGKDVVVGASAVIVKDLLEAGTYVGMPAKKIK
jgi:sugar O-acyltransferase (sialic acid O-acetyltransferase NeuD family)